MTRISGIATALVLLCLSGTPAAQTPAADPETVVRDLFWGQLMANGGETFFCKQPFTRKGFTVTEGHIYPLSHVRNALKCGTPTQCEKLDQYRRIAADLHNLVPVQSRIEMWRRNAKYDELGDSASEKDCGMRESTQFIEPPQQIKGDIARTIAYMVQSYGLPWLGLKSTYVEWNRIDPPDEKELARDLAIAGLQGQGNAFVTDPGSLANL
ncbi:MAG: endonuclease [Marinobacter sp.]|uniref:endonuclease n=1 Tax=Marinobacter sp. TaxID=50741 RepID=UPI00299F22A8|nr:endonuclease [Marinobacter sp.]MDX1635663.1 endonuclease [Marinobacter sp.]